MKTDKERQTFIEAFWKQRDPSPATLENEFKKEHYRRLAYANGHYAEGATPGWKTDSGRNYVLFGDKLKPAGWRMKMSVIEGVRAGAAEPPKAVASSSLSFGLTATLKAAQLEEMMKAEGAFFVDDKIKKILAANLFMGHLPNPKAVGRSPQQLAQMYGFSVPDWARILVVRLNGVGREEPLSGEKLTTVLGWYEAEGWEAGCDRCIEMINYGGRGHSLVIHEG